MAYSQWIRVAEWPRTNGTLISKDISRVGARLIFHYYAGGRRFTGLAFRFGSEKSVRAALEFYEPGTSQMISYNPKDPGEVETILSYSWEQFKGPVVFATFGVFLMFGGVSVYRWSCGAPVESPKS